MIYLLDTNAWVSYINRGDSAVTRQLAIVGAGNARLCSITKAELYFGAFKSQKVDANLKHLDNLFAAFLSLPFGDAAAEHYGRIRAELARAGTPIDPNDLLIAAIALAEDIALVTHNTREFSPVRNLKLEDWEAP